MNVRNFIVVFVDRREDHEPAFLNIPCTGMDFWLKDGFWEFRFMNAQPDELGVATHFLKIKEHDLLQVIGQSGVEVGKNG